MLVHFNNGVPFMPLYYIGNGKGVLRRVFLKKFFFHLYRGRSRGFVTPISEKKIYVLRYAQTESPPFSNYHY